MLNQGDFISVRVDQRLAILPSGFPGLGRPIRSARWPWAASLTTNGAIGSTSRDVQIVIDRAIRNVKTAYEELL
ncbi:MAG TPA: hypothetical protein VJ656_08640 [Pyrinomonadaceae bacterium]|nr:hypothetical protein [Pyrinomonadaceae bacterium]